MIRERRDLNFSLEEFDKIKTMEELENFVEKAFINNLGFVPFYMEVKPGFGQHANDILNDILSKNNEEPQINLLARTLLRRTESFNKAFYPHLVDLPNGIFNAVCDYTIGKMEHPYIPGKLLETYDRGGNLGFVFYGDNKKIIDKARNLQGSTGNPAEGTIRYTYGLRDQDGNIRPHKTANVIHCSDSAISGLKEIYMAVSTPNTWGASATLVGIQHNDMPKLFDLMYFTSMIYGAVVDKEQKILSQPKQEKQEQSDKKITPAQKRLAAILEENKLNKKNDDVPVTPVNDGREGK